MDSILIVINFILKMKINQFSQNFKWLFKD